MKCKNCGANLSKNASMCLNCGAIIKQDEDYIKLAEIPDENYQYEKPIIRNPKKFVIISCIIIILVGVISFFGFYYFQVSQPQPELSFSSGQGTINKDEDIIYVTIDDSSKLEFIHGVQLYEGTVDGKSFNIDKSISSDYSYTKNIDDSFRAIYFDVADLDMTSGGNYTYTFQMTFSFSGDDNQYTYYETLNVVGGSNQDISDIIFDHSTAHLEATTTGDSQKETTTSSASSTETTTAKAQSTSYVTEGYWYTSPYKNGDSYAISAINFKEDGSYTTTSYSKQGTGNWNVTTSNGNYAISDNKLTVDNGVSAEKTEYTIDFGNSSLTYTDDSGNTTNLTPRKYNSVQNVEDFFGL